VGVSTSQNPMVRHGLLHGYLGDLTVAGRIVLIRMLQEHGHHSSEPRSSVFKFLISGCSITRCLALANQHTHTHTPPRAPSEIITYTITLQLRAPCGGGLEYLHRCPASRKRRQKGELSARWYNWATLFLGDINTGTWLSRLRESQMRQ
jgi:hypothetical protein